MVLPGLEVISYRIGAGHDEHAARRRQFPNINACLEAMRAATSPGQIWMAPTTCYGYGRWFFVGRYDGRGRVLLGAEDIEATAEGLMELMFFRMR